MRKAFFVCVSICIFGLAFFILASHDSTFTVTPTRIRLQHFNFSPSSYAHFVQKREDWFMYQGFCVWTLHSDDDVHPDDVTLCTQGSPEYLHHALEQCNRWKGPMSVAVYGREQFQVVEELIHRFRKCSSCVRSLVTWHVFYKSKGECSVRLRSPVLNKSWNCSDKKHFKNFVRKNSSVYPINVARNLAIQKSRTHFVMSVDVELYPSNGLAPRFLRMLKTNLGLQRRQGSRVWTMPVFEVESDVEAPRNKSELRILFSKGKAITFHKYRCLSCHQIPNLEHWMELNGNDHALSIVQVLKRDTDHKLQDWEPFFIGTRNEPFFDPRLSWEGKQNKMQVAFEMCVKDYEFLVLDDAFLVHSPGINRYDASKEKFRFKYAAQNEKIIKQIKKELGERYPNATRC